MGPATIAKVNPKSLYMTALKEIVNISHPQLTSSNYVLSSGRTTHAGTAGVMFDAPDALEG